MSLPINIAKLAARLAEGVHANEPHELIVRDMNATLHAIADSDARAIATWHPFGFLKLAFPGDRGDELRIHIWHPVHGRRQAHRSVCHQHNWFLTSHVALGQLRDVRFAVAENPAGQFRLYEVRYVTGESHSVATDKFVDCSVAQEATLSAGDRYVIDVEEFHTTQVPDGLLTATVVVASNHQETRPYNVRVRDGEPLYVYQRAQPLAPELRAILGDVTDRLATSLGAEI